MSRVCCQLGHMMWHTHDGMAEQCFNCLDFLTVTTVQSAPEMLQSS
jgi:hypothetical protein